MAKPDKRDLFKRLTTLFKSGPIVKRKIRNIDTTVALPDRTRSSAVALFQRSLSPTYSHITNNAYNMQERMSRYQDFNEMELTAEINSALDIYCLAGSNRVLLSDGSSETIENLYNSGLCDFFVISYDQNGKCFGNGLCSEVLKTGKNQQIYKVTLKNGNVLRLTENHKVLTTATRMPWVRVKELLVPIAEREAEKKSVIKKKYIENLVPPTVNAALYRNDEHRGIVDELVDVVSVEPDGFEDVYDLHVMNYHNFVISNDANSDSWTVVHNSDESVAQDDKGRTLHVYSNNPRIKETLEELYYNTLNCEFNLRPWTRNLVKYGDFFLYNDVSPDQGVINAIPVPVNEIEREEGYDREDPLAIRFRWVTMGNRILENWEVTHMRLLGNDMFLPYGSSVLEGARRIWRQLILIEDAMLVYRIVRSPERRVFYIDVGNTPNDEIPHYMEQARATLRTQQVVDKDTGRVDLRYNPLSVDEDYFIAVRGGESATKIETLAGGQNTATVEDVQYIQRKLFAALKVPKAYLGFDEMLSSKATLAQEDIRFSRTINMIQRTLISELNKIAIIHLYSCGWTGDDLLNFTLRLSNPSTVAQQQKLELYRTKFEIASGIPEGMLSRDYIRRNVFGMTDEEIKIVERELIEDAKTRAALEAAGMGPGTTEEGFGEIGVGGPALGGPEPGPAGAGTEPTPEAPPPAGTITAGEKYAGSLITAEERPATIHDVIDEDDEIPILSVKDESAPVKVQNAMDRALYNRGRRRTHGASKTHFPDFNRSLNAKHDDPYDSGYLRSLTSNPLEGIDGSLGEGTGLFDEDDDDAAKLPHYDVAKPVLSADVSRMLNGMKERFGVSKSNGILREVIIHDDEEIVIDAEDE
jgi:hypothetical protein